METTPKTARKAPPAFLVFCLVLAACNLHLFTRVDPGILVYFPSAVRAGEWWRVVTHPLVHVSPYHLALDATAFWLLWSALAERPWGVRLSAVALAGTGSLLLSATCSPLVENAGLCGLSGIAHGLTAFTCIDMMRDRRDPSQVRVGALVFGGLILKTVIEAASGHVVLAGLHLGAVGLPVVETHAGGVLGGLAAAFLELKGHHT